MPASVWHWWWFGWKRELVWILLDLVWTGKYQLLRGSPCLSSNESISCCEALWFGLEGRLSSAVKPSWHGLDVKVSVSMGPLDLSWKVSTLHCEPFLVWFWRVSISLYDSLLVWFGGESTASPVAGPSWPVGYVSAVLMLLWFGISSWDFRCIWFGKDELRWSQFDLVWLKWAVRKSVLFGLISMS